MIILTKTNYNGRMSPNIFYLQKNIRFFFKRKELFQSDILSLRNKIFTVLRTFMMAQSLQLFQADLKNQFRKIEALKEC